MKTYKLAFIDIESTGLDPEKHEIIEIGAVIVEQKTREGETPVLRILEEIDIKVKPEHIERAEPEALRVNHYDKTLWENALPQAEAMKLLASKINGAIIGGHNVSFDISFLEKAFKRHNIPNPLGYRFIDTFPLAFALLAGDPKVQKFSLGALCEYFGVKNERAHTALSDIRATLGVYAALMKGRIEEKQQGLF